MSFEWNYKLTIFPTERGPCCYQYGLKYVTFNFWSEELQIPVCCLFFCESKKTIFTIIIRVSPIMLITFNCARGHRFNFMQVSWSENHGNCFCYSTIPLLVIFCVYYLSLIIIHAVRQSNPKIAQWMADHGMGKNYSLLEQYYEQRFDGKIFISLQFFLFQPLVNILFIKNFNSNISNK